jgi:hypothetical protein
MSESNFSKETFLSLLSKNSGIVIPIIQRAYTQGGRGNDETIEKKGVDFLKYLINALQTDNKIELDFIYGTIENGKIQPLDGQQRLTTLFLLHWYIAQKECRLTDEVKKLLRSFTYETRSSSRSFCRKLCGFKVPVDDVSSPLSCIIENQNWFVLSWKNDPSVLSMLGMLNKIHESLKGQMNPLWDNLISAPAIAPITFFYTPLEVFKLTDDLYIKMNARGKELTLFEKFKASIEQKIDGDNWDDGKLADKSFGNQMDNEWTDLFWQFRVDVRDEKEQLIGFQIDKSLLRFFSAVLVNHFAGTDEGKTTRLFNNPEALEPCDFDKDSYSYLYNTTNLYYSAWKSLKEGVSINAANFWWGYTLVTMNSFDDFFKLFIAFNNDKTMTWQQQSLFYGFSIYLHNNKHIKIEKLYDWLRFVRNMITNGTIDAYTPFVSSKKRLDEFAQMSDDIYSHLNATIATTGFAYEQMKEEIQKAKIYAHTPTAKRIIQELEDCKFCRGRVRFVLNCLSIVDTITNMDTLETLKNVFLEHLNTDAISNDFRRAMFVCDDNYYYYRGDSSYLGEGKYCLIDGCDDMINKYAYSNDSRTECLKKLLLMLCKSDINTIIDSYKPTPDTPNWKNRLITEPELLEKCKEHLITIPWGDQNDHCYILYGKRPSYSDYWGYSYEKIQ